jgi:hypothetical protein
MTRVAGSQSRIEGLLEKLEDQYGSFPVNQTTVSLPDEQFEHVRDERGSQTVDAYVEVQNDDHEILHVSDGNAVHLPGDAIDLSNAIESQVTEAVSELTGVDCTVESIESATITGLRNEDDPERDTQYRLVVLFDARYRAGNPDADAHWEREPSHPDTLFA